MADVKMKTDSHLFKFRVGGIVLVNDKVLGVEMMDGGFFCLPGGHNQLGEVTSDTVIREMKEELNIDVSIIKDVLFVEDLYINRNNQNTHELGSYYLVEPLDLSKVDLTEHTVIEKDEGLEKKLHFKWFTKDELKETDFRPYYIKEIILNSDYEFKHLTVKR